MLYSDRRIAALMNEWFVNVKVDREPRPEVDETYMLARHPLAGSGGWPNNVFLTPELKPFYAGYYLPLPTDRFGRPGFRSVLRVLHQASFCIASPGGQAPRRVYRDRGAVF